MKYEHLPNQLFIDNRDRFKSNLPPGALAVFNANDVMPTNADGHMGFVQNSDLFYLSGIDQEESILVLFPFCRDPQHREILFLKETSELIAIWEGHKYTKEEARATSGVPTIYWLSQFKTIFNQLMSEADTLYLNTNEHLRAHIEVETRDARFIKWCKEHYPLHTYKRSAPILQKLRAIKSSLEIEVMKKAMEITGKGFERLLKFVKPGVNMKLKQN